jgi:hypothetical protein
MMAKQKTLIGSVSFFDDDHKLHVYEAGQTLKAEHEKYVTNPDVFGDAAKVAEPAASAEAENENPYDGIAFNDLKTLAKERGLSAAGKTADIVARLVEADAAAKAAGDTKPVDEMDRDELVAHALEQGVSTDDITDETSEAEIVALIENAKG